RLQPSDYADRDQVRALYDLVEGRVLAEINGMTELDLAHTVTFDFTPPNEASMTLTHTVAQIIGHMVNHGTDHRAQLLRLLYDFGAPTFDQDYIIYLRGQA
ncbi:MAG: DinB family protein, partial [Armatimonadetes bacterium]|nr:DinB family protein [Anaerolineae bacterium]